MINRAPKGGSHTCGCLLHLYIIVSIATIHFQLLLCKNVMVLFAMQIYEENKHLKSIRHYHSFYSNIFSIAAHNEL